MLQAMDFEMLQPLPGRPCNVGRHRPSTRRALPRCKDGTSRSIRLELAVLNGRVDARCKAKRLDESFSVSTARMFTTTSSATDIISTSGSHFGNKTSITLRALVLAIEIIRATITFHKFWTVKPNVRACEQPNPGSALGLMLQHNSTTISVGDRSRTINGKITFDILETPTGWARLGFFTALVSHCVVTPCTRNRKILLRSAPFQSTGYRGRGRHISMFHTSNRPTENLRSHHRTNSRMSTAGSSIIQSTQCGPRQSCWDGTLGGTNISQRAALGSGTSSSNNGGHAAPNSRASRDITGIPQIDLADSLRTGGSAENIRRLRVRAGCRFGTRTRKL